MFKGKNNNNLFVSAVSPLDHQPVAFKILEHSSSYNRDRPIYRSTDIIGRYLTFWISVDMQIRTLQW